MIRKTWHAIWKCGGGWPAALAITAFCYALLQGLTWVCFGVIVAPDAVVHDLAAHLLLGAFLYALSRGPGWFFASLGMLLTLLHSGNAAKVAILGGPVMPDDLWALPNLFLLLEGWFLTLAALGGIAAGLLLMRMPDLRKMRAWIAVALIASGSTAMVLWPSAITVTMDNTFGNLVWNQRDNFEKRGVLIHLVQESARFIARVGRPPNREEVAEAVSLLNVKTIAASNNIQQALTPLLPRNVHIIVLESFWDPVLLGAATLSDDPLDQRFRALWETAGRSQILSPVFGGYTANAEFEALCGFPVVDDAVFFEGRLRQDAPCLPFHLAAAGYITMASHPNVAAFWNRIHAYRRMGFQRYFSLKDFAQDDMNREILSDASLYRQVVERTRPLLGKGVPVLNYILTFFGHLDYPLSTSRPAIIKAATTAPLIEAYANTVYYKSRELMDFLEVLQLLDPEGLIVIFGDHLPFLDNNFGGYAAAGLLATDRGEFTDDMFKVLTATPLLIINGNAGPLPVGDLSLYRLPDLILTLLGDDRPSIMGITKTPTKINIRPLPGMQLVTSGREVTATCRGANAEPEWCGEVSRWLGAVEILGQDIFSGRAYLFEPAGQEEYVRSL